MWHESIEELELIQWKSSISWLAKCNFWSFSGCNPPSFRSALHHNKEMELNNESQKFYISSQLVDTKSDIFRRTGRYWAIGFEISNVKNINVQMGIIKESNYFKQVGETGKIPSMFPACRFSHWSFTLISTLIFLTLTLLVCLIASSICGLVPLETPIRWRHGKFSAVHLIESRIFH